MKFTNAPNDPVQTGIIDRVVSETGLVEVGVYPVLFGYRIRAGYVGDPMCIIDWCCGDSSKMLHSHYVALLLILRRREESGGCFHGIPRTSAIKPCWKDKEFCNDLSRVLTSDGQITQADESPAG